MSSPYSWHFYRIGGFDQVEIRNGEDLKHLSELDQKLWVALSCPVAGVEFDRRTLEFIDGNQDGRIRAPEVLEALKWALDILKDPEDLIRRKKELSLSSIKADHPEGKKILLIAQKVLRELGRPDADSISLEDIADPKKIFSSIF